MTDTTGCIFDMPKMVTLQECRLPIVEGDVKGYRVLRLPQELKELFAEGASVVRLNSLDIARSMPDFGGRGSGEYHSLLPHQDHLEPSEDPRRFLMLTKHEDGARGSSTLVMTPSVARMVLPVLEPWMTDEQKRERISAERSYDTRFLITKEQYDSCFDEADGYERVASHLLDGQTTAKQELSIRLGLLGYLIRGPSADEAMQEVVHACNGKFLEERWERGGVVIIDNRKVFHARQGGNTPALQRNFGT